MFEGTHWRYNIPWTNFAGWILSGFLGFVEREGWHRWYEKKTGKQWILTESDRYALVVMMVFWTTYAAIVGMWGAAIVGCGVLSVIGYELRTHRE
ncbi:MAG: carotenoid biosynthesis protein [Candidatus Absconditabacterales bacterium]|nr:carotenoid biosynthesis protein [Candidatus Absconditabacterales bacterium]